jgi:tetratricopeptide (TPR) repeat protein
VGDGSGVQAAPRDRCSRDGRRGSHYRCPDELPARDDSLAVGSSPEQFTRSERIAFHSRGVALGEQGVERLHRNDPACIPLFEEALAIAAALGDVEAGVRSRINIGRAYSRVDAIRDYRRADQVIQEALQDARRHAAASPPVEAALALADVRVDWLRAQARAGASQHDLRVSYSKAAEALQYARRCLVPWGSRRDRARLALTSGDLLSAAGEYRAAVRKYQQAIKLFDEDSPQTIIARIGISACLDELGRSADAESDRDEARRLADKAGLVIEER